MMNHDTTTKSINPCEKYMDLFSSTLDGVIDKQEQKHFKLHLEECPGCKLEFDRWQIISDNLRNIPPVPVPPDFSQNIMTAISREQPKGTVFRKVFSAHRGLAAAAAGLMLLAGSLGSYGLVKIARNGPEVAITTQSPPVIQLNDPTKTAVPSGVPDSPASANGGSNNLDSSSEPPVSSTDNNQPASKNSEPPAISESSSPSGQTKPAVTATALLSEKMVINSRLIKVKAADPAGVAAQAAVLTDSLGARANTLVNRPTDSQGTVIMQITAGEAAAADLAVKLAALGTVIENTKNSQDITSQYQLALARRQELIGLLAAAEDKDKQGYQAELEALNRQLGDWNKAGSSTSVMFWVEK